MTTVTVVRKNGQIAIAADTLVTFGDTRLWTRLAFLYRRDRENDPAIRAVRDVVGHVWTPADTTSHTDVRRAA